MIAKIKWILLAVWLCLATNCMAQNAPLLSPLQGEVSVLEAESPSKGDLEGLEVGMELTSELQGTSGGDLNFVNLLRLNATAPISRNLTIEAASLSTCMTASESIVGDLQAFSNIEAGNIIFALSLLDVEWQINERHTLYAGIRNMNEDYFTSPVTSFFTNSSCGIFPTIGANFPVANYPVASVGVHYMYEGASGSIGSNGSMSVQASLYNGVGYNRFTGRENVFRVCPKSDGVFGLAQVEYEHGESKYFLGGCGHYGDAADDGTQKLSTALWGYTEQSLSKDFSLIAGYSHAFSSAACSDFVGIGGKWSLGKVELGAFQDYACFSECKEWATELTCKISLLTNFHLQPSAHVITTGSKTKAVGTLRAVLSL